MVRLSHLEHSLVSYYRHLDQLWASVFIIIYYMKKPSDEGCEMLWSMGIYQYVIGVDLIVGLFRRVMQQVLFHVR